MAIEETPANSRELLARVDFAPGTDSGMESMLGFRQDLGFAGSVQSVAAVALHPEVSAGGGEGLDEAGLRSWETIQLGDEFEAEVGSDQALMRLAGASPQAAILPFATVAWRDGDQAIRYRMATQIPGTGSVDDTEARSWLPAVSARDGVLAIEHGLHQELGWERRTDNSSVALLVFDDHISNPAVEAMSHFANGSNSDSSVLLDPISGLLHAAGPAFSTAGVSASIEHRIPGGNHLRLSYANGNALVLSSGQPSAALVQLLAGLHTRRAQSYSLSLSGTLDGTGTHWQASYRWQPEDTITEVAPFTLDAFSPYLNLRLHQPLHRHGGNSGGFEAILDVRNLLAEGYCPYLLNDGSLLIFAQGQRSIRAGLAFNF
jgi:hypothetical protein